MFITKISIIAGFLFVGACFGAFPPEKPAEVDVRNRPVK